MLVIRAAVLLIDRDGLGGTGNVLSSIGHAFSFDMIPIFAQAGLKFDLSFWKRTGSAVVYLALTARIHALREVKRRACRRSTTLRSPPIIMGSIAITVRAYSYSTSL